MKRLIRIITLTSLLLTTISYQTGCNGDTDKTESVTKESNRWLELLRILPENESTLTGAFLQDTAYFGEKKQQYPQISNEFAIISNPPTLFGTNPRAYNDEEWKEALGFVRSDVDQTIYAVTVPPRQYEAVRGRFDRDEIYNAVKTGPFNEYLETMTYKGYEFYSWGEDFDIHMDRRSGLRPLGRGHRLALVDDFACWVLWTDGVKEMIDSYESDVKSLADNECYKLLAGVLEEFDTITAFFSTESQSYELFSEAFKEIIEDSGNNEVEQMFVEEIKRLPRLKPYRAYATGAGLNEKGYYLVISLMNPDDETAKENANLLEERIESSKLTWSDYRGQPWSEIIEEMEIGVKGQLTTAKLYGKACTIWDDFVGFYMGAVPLLIHE